MGSQTNLLPSLFFMCKSQMVGKVSVRAFRVCKKPLLKKHPGNTTKRKNNSV